MILENGVLKIEILPYLGGKITSFYHKEKSFELAAQTDRRMEDLPDAAGSFGPYAFGMDDAFPNIDAEQIEWKGRKLAYPDHGEIWMAEFDVTDQAADRVTLCWASPMGYRYEKTLQLAGNALHIRYHIVHEGSRELPCFWTWHGLMRYEEDMEVILPKGTARCRNVLTGPVLGVAGTVYPVKNGACDFTVIPKAKSRSMSKFYVEDPVAEGCCGLRYPSQNVSCIMQYDERKLPYLGFWITAGGFQGEYNCALEPTNGFYDSISCAHGNNKLPVLQSGEHMDFCLTITLA